MCSEQHVLFVSTICIIVEANSIGHGVISVACFSFGALVIVLTWCVALSNQARTPADLSILAVIVDIAFIGDVELNTSGSRDE